MEEEDLLDCLLSVAAGQIAGASTSTSFEDALNVANVLPEKKPKKQLSNVQRKDDLRLSTIHGGDTDSSDDEDNRDFENRKYNESGRDIKHLLEPPSSTKDWVSKPPTPKKNPPIAVATQASTPLLGIRVINPLISSKTLEDRLVGREVVPLVRLKMFVRNIQADKDWIISGVLVNKSPTKISQKGKNYCIWTLSDLKTDLKTVTLFLFSSAYKQLWKTNPGTVIGILNPSVMEQRDGSKDEACLSIDNHQRVMIIGQSKDLGVCKSLKKNGDRCTAFVNTNTCPFCIYHVKQEYQKASRRSELQSGFAGRGLTALRNKVLGKDQVFYGGKIYSAIPAKKSKKQTVKDQGRLMALAGHGGASRTVKKTLKQKQAAGLEVAADQRRKDLERLKQLGIHSNVSNKVEIFNGTLSRDVTVEDSKNLALNVISKLKEKGTKSSGEEIDLNVDFKRFRENFVATEEVKNSTAPMSGDVASTSSPKTDIPFLSNPKIERPFLTNPKSDVPLPAVHKRSIRAKQNALSWVHNNGPIEKQNPNNTRGTDKGKKRALENFDENSNPKKSKIESNEFFSERFKKIMAASSTHTDLLQARDDEEQEKYFNKLEMKERMEEKMLTTYKISCKAVRCLKCKYTSYSALDSCKAEKHPLRVFDATKRFFKCGNCTNRTVCLTFVPLEPCKNCGMSKWEKTSMMKERKVEIAAPKLSIRGGEQKFTNSIVGDANLDLLVPDD